MKKLLPLIVFAIFSFAKIKAQSSVPVGDFTLDALLDSIKVEMNKAHIPGLMLSIVTPDSVLYDGGLGMSNLQEKRPVDHTQLFRLGSISKSFAALCILKLESEGKFSIQDKLKDVAPEVPFENEWEATHPVRIVHLLEHSAGFDDMHFKAFYNWADKEPSALDMVKLHQSSLKTRWQPGSRMSYSNPDYVILTYIIEKYSGMSYHDYVQQAIFEPLGMTHSNFESFPKEKERYAQGYAWKNGHYEEVPFYAVNAGMAGALNSCSADMAKFVQFFLNRGRVDTTQVFPAELIRKMETPTATLAAQNGLWTSYALANYPSQFDKAVSFRGHNGGIDGFSSVYAYNSGMGVGFALSNNAATSNGRITTLIIRYLTQGISLMKPKAESITQGTIDTFSGYFDMKSPRNQVLYFTEKINSPVQISFNNDTLVWKPFMDTPQKYVHLGNHLFRHINNNAPTLALMTDEQGTPIVVNGAYYEKSNGIPLRRIWFFSALVLTGIFLLFGTIWLILALFKVVSRASVQPTFSLWLAVVGLVTAFIAFIFLMNHLRLSGIFNAATLLVFIGTTIFGIASLLGLIQALRMFGKIKSGFLKFYLLITAAAMLSLAVFLYQNDWIGIQLWNY